MLRFLIAAIAFTFTVQICNAQSEQVQLYKQIYRTADSLNKLGTPFSINDATRATVKELDNTHPSQYFQKAIELVAANKLNDASFLYYLGVLRYRYYNSVNPKYQAGDDGALAASLKYVVGETVQMYLRCNVENYIATLKFVSDYFNNNDYTFYSKEKNVDEYKEVGNSLSTMINELEKDKAKYQKEWEEERKSMMANIDKMMEEYDKLTPEEKAELGK